MVEDRARESIYPVLRLAGVVVIVAGLRAAAPLVIPFLLALFVATLSIPVLNGLRSIGLPRLVAVLATMLVSISLVAGVGFLVAGSVGEFTSQLPRYQDSLDEALGSMVTWAEARGMPHEFADYVQAGAVLNLLGSTVSRLAAVVQNLVLVILITLFMLFEAAYFPAKLRVALGTETGSLVRLRRITGDVQRYLAIKTAISLLTGSLIAVWLAVLQVDFPIFWGLVAFALNYIPNIGSFVAGVPTVTIAALQDGPGQALLVAIGYIVVNLALGNFLEPNLMGRRFGLAPLVVVLSLLFWGWVWGPVGMLLSVPLTMILKISLENSRDLRWVGVLLGNGVPIPAAEPTP